MPILKNMIAPSGAQVSFHHVQRAEIDFNSEHQIAHVLVQSWADEEGFAVNSGLNAVWSWYLGVPLAALLGAATIQAAIERYLIDTPGTEFVSGSIMPFMTATEAMRLRQRAQIKQSRELILSGGFEYEGKVYDTKGESLVKVLGRVTALTLTGSSDETVWTLADNSSITLSAEKMKAMGIAMSLFVDQQHAIYRKLVAKLDAAVGAADIQAIAWPTTPLAVNELLGLTGDAPKPPL